ncbi:MAG: sigma-70 family RNA polymerase sigma factor [Polyangiaceae bacterium]
MNLALDPLTELDRITRSERGRLVRVARSEGLGAEDALDCVHDALTTFLHLAMTEALPADPAAHPPFLVTMVRNAARNGRRLHRNARPHESIEEAEPASVEPIPEALVAEAEEHVRLRGCVDRLCDTQRAVVTLRMLEEHDGEDVAETLGISRGHVDVLLHRAKRSLRACMTEERAPARNLTERG